MSTSSLTSTRLGTCSRVSTGAGRVTQSGIREMPQLVKLYLQNCTPPSGTDYCNSDSAFTTAALSP